MTHTLLMPHDAYCIVILLLSVNGIQDDTA